jgi:hypothetical protein
MILTEGSYWRKDIKTMRKDDPEARSIASRWRDFWFAPDTPDNLAFCRILFFGSLLLFYGLLPRFGDFSAWGGVSNALWQPIFLFSALRIPVFDSEIIAILQGIWMTALAMSCVGLLTRLSTATSLILGFYLLGLPHSFGKIHHYDGLLVLAFLVLALSRCADRWSLDEIFVRQRRQSTRRLASGEYTWPVRAMWLIMSLVFCAAGIAKLRHSGLAWISSDSLQIWLIEHQYHVANSDPLVSWGPYFATVPWLPRVLAATSIGLELGYPLAMFSRRARWIFVPGVALMQLSIRFLLGPSFEQFMICNLFWVRWNWVADRIKALLRKISGRGGSPLGGGHGEVDSDFALEASAD